MKKTSTVVVCMFMLTCFVFYASHSNAQTGPVVDFGPYDDPTNTLIDFDSVFFATANFPYTPPQSGVDGFYISNSGDAPLIFEVTTSNTDFWGDLNIPFTLLPGESQQPFLIFTPSQTGPVGGVITVTTNDPNYPEIVFNVKGYGLESPVDNGDLSFDLVVGETVTKELIVRNTTPNRAKFRISPELEHIALDLIVSRDGVVLAWDDDFILESGDSATIDLFFEYVEVTGPGEEDAEIPLKITCEPFHDSHGRTWEVHKIIYVDGIFPLATIGIPGAVYKELPISTIDSTSFQIDNHGNTDLHYTIDTDSLLNETGGLRLMSMGFEDLTPGVAQYQGGWAELEYVFYINQNHTWAIDTTNAFMGSKHLRGTAEPYRHGELVAPQPNGQATIIDMMVNLNSAGSHWQFNAGDYGYLKLIVSADGSLSVLNEVQSYDPQPISATLPAGYFNLRFIKDSQTSQHLITIAGDTIYSGPNNSDASFNRFSISLEDAGSGSILDIDDLKWIDGSQNIRLITIQPESGSIAPMSSKTIDVRYDTRNIDSGTHVEIFKIESNDESNPIVFLPTTTGVKPNSLPVLTGDFNGMMTSGETKSFTFSATDSDDSLISVTAFNIIPSGAGGGPAGYIWFEETNSGNGFVTYTIETDRTNYDGKVEGLIQAVDARGQLSSRFFYITIHPYRENDMALTNFKSGNVVAYATDTITYDVARADIDQLTIEARLPSEIGADGIEFIIDGVSINRDYSQPYYVTPWTLAKLTEGYHVMTVNSFFGRTPDEFWVYASRQTIIHVINSAAVVNYQVVNKDGVKLMDLVNGSVIDLSKIGSTSFNVLAGVSTETVRSVKFTLNNITARIDNNSPYALGGNPIIGDTNWKPKAGYYTLTATPYVKYFAWGPKGVPSTIRFRVINGVAPTASPARIASSNESQQNDSREISIPEDILSVYPIPVVNELHIELHESIKGTVVVNILNAQGQSIHARAGAADEFRNYIVNTIQLGMSRGVYFVIVNQPSGTRVVKKFIKE